MFLRGWRAHLVNTFLASLLLLFFTCFWICSLLVGLLVLNCLMVYLCYFQKISHKKLCFLIYIHIHAGITVPQWLTTPPMLVFNFFFSLSMPTFSHLLYILFCICSICWICWFWRVFIVYLCCFQTIFLKKVMYI